MYADPVLNSTHAPLTLRRVANGWVLTEPRQLAFPGSPPVVHLTEAEFVFATFDEAAAYVRSHGLDRPPPIAEMPITPGSDAAS